MCVCEREREDVCVIERECERESERERASERTSERASAPARVLSGEIVYTVTLLYYSTWYRVGHSDD